MTHTPATIIATAQAQVAAGTHPFLAIAIMASPASPDLITDALWTAQRQGLIW